jgi:hypothetical protein
MYNLRDFVKKGLKESMGLLDADEILAESTSAEEWWNCLPGKRRKKVCEALGLSKGKDRSLFSKLSKGVQSEIEAYYSKHKGKVEQVEVGAEVLEEAREKPGKMFVSAVLPMKVLDRIEEVFGDTDPDVYSAARRIREKVIKAIDRVVSPALAMAIIDVKYALNGSKDRAKADILDAAKMAGVKVGR